MHKKYLLSGILVLALLFTGAFSTGVEAAWWLASAPGGGSSLSRTGAGTTAGQTGTPIKLGGTNSPSFDTPATSAPAAGTSVTRSQSVYRPGAAAPSAGNTAVSGKTGNVINLSRGWSVPTIPAAPAAPNTPATPVSDGGTTQPVSGLTAQEQYLYDLINQARAAEGLSPLQADLRLVRLARLKAQDLVANNYFDHTSPTYGTPFAMMLANGINFKYAGENIAEAGNVGSAHAQLMTSPGHRAHIMEPHYTHAGIGVAPANPAGVIVVEMFIGN